MSIYRTPVVGESQNTISKSRDVLKCLTASDFKESLECQYGLLDHLLENGCLTRGEVNDLRWSYFNHNEGRNNKLISLITPDSIGKFEQALEESNQSHLVNFIRKNGIRGPLEDGNWPVNDSDRRLIQKKFSYLVQDLPYKEIVDYLFEKKCISREQMDTIQVGRRTTQEKNRELLQIMMRRSIGQLSVFYDYLKEKEPHIWTEMIKLEGNDVQQDVNITSKKTVNEYLSYKEVENVCGKYSGEIQDCSGGNKLEGEGLKELEFRNLQIDYEEDCFDEVDGLPSHSLSTSPDSGFHSSNKTGSIVSNSSIRDFTESSTNQSISQHNLVSFDSGDASKGAILEYHQYEEVKSVKMDLQRPENSDDRNKQNLHTGEFVDSKLENENMNMACSQSSTEHIQLFLSSNCKVDIIKNSDEVTGITIMDNEIVVIRDAKSIINIYDLNSLKGLRGIDVPGMHWPQSIAGCSNNKCLYISDAGIRYVHRVDLSENIVTRWKMEEKYVPFGLSLTEWCTLLVTEKMRHSPVEYSRVVEYTTDGKVVREIKFDVTLVCAWQTVHFSSDRFVVSHGMLDSPLHRVCVINTECEVIKSFGRNAGNGDDQLNEPYSLTIDNKSKHIFVADRHNHRIVLLDADLTYLGQIQVPGDLRQPTRVYFDTATQRLFVGEYSGRILVINPSLIKI